MPDVRQLQNDAIFWKSFHIEELEHIAIVQVCGSF